MQQVLRADDMDVAVPSARSSSPRRSTKYAVAGLAAATAGVLAITPVTPAPTPLAADVHYRAVELNAVVNPLVTLQETLSKTLTNLSLLQTGIPAASTSLLEGIANPAIYAEFAELLTANATNPLPLISVLQNFPLGQLTTALQSSSNILNTNLQNLPTILQNTLGYLQTGQFVEAFSEVNVYFLVQLLERPGGPLFPIFSIPGDTLAAIPGGGVLANLADAVFTRGIATGLTRALLVAPITSTLFVAETLDHVQASYRAGDVAGALTELLSAPIGVVDAFLNGYVPDFPTRSPFQGLLSPNGFVDYFLVDVPNAIATALKLPPQAPPVVAPVTAEVAASAPTDLPTATFTTMISTDSTAPDSSPLDTDATTPETDSTPDGTETEAAETTETTETTEAADTTETTSTAGSGGTTATPAGDDEDDAAEATDTTPTTSGGSTSGTATTSNTAKGSNSAKTSNDGDDSDSDSSKTGSSTTGGTTGSSSKTGSSKAESSATGSSTTGSSKTPGSSTDD